MKNRELIELSAILKDFSTIKNKKFAYAIFKNKNIIEQELKIFDEIKFEEHKDQADYDKERNELCIKHSEKDENGVSKIVNKQYVIVNPEVFKLAFETEILTKYKDVINHIDSENKKYNEFLETESSVELTKVSFDDLPEELDANSFDALQHMID